MIPFTTWRAEIAADLAAAHVKLAGAQERLAEAEDAVALAKSERRDLSDAIAKLGPNATIASALLVRVREHDDRLHQVDAAMVRERNSVKSAHADIRDYEDALRQIEKIAPAAAVIEAVPA